MNSTYSSITVLISSFGSVRRHQGDISFEIKLCIFTFVSNDREYFRGVNFRPSSIDLHPLPAITNQRRSYLGGYAVKVTQTAVTHLLQAYFRITSERSLHASISGHPVRATMSRHPNLQINNDTDSRCWTQQVCVEL